MKIAKNTSSLLSLYSNTVQLGIYSFLLSVLRQVLQRGEPPQRTGFSVPLRFVKKIDFHKGFYP
jgi:hypothetical protein